MVDTRGARGLAAIDSGAPVEIAWSQGLCSTSGCSIPDGTPRADLARKVCLSCIKPEQQAIYSTLVANGPSNTRAYDFMTPERARVLPSSAKDIKGLAATDHLWWGINRARVVDRFQDLLLA